MKHRHLEIEPGTPVEDLPSSALHDLLERGDLESWRPILRAISRAPYGGVASRVLRLVDAFPMYGTSPLWRAWIDRRRARAIRQHAHMAPVRLATLRREEGLTQNELAHRIGMSQSDLSKLEHRADVRLSTLRAYAQGLGGHLHILFVNDTEQREILVGSEPYDGASPTDSATPA